MYQSVTSTSRADEYLKILCACSNGIINEYIKATEDAIMPLYVAFLNFLVLLYVDDTVV